MKKIFFICCISISALAALSTSATVSKHAMVGNHYSLNDTVPPMNDTTHNWGDTMQHNNMMDTAMNPRSDSTNPAPPQ